MTTKDIIGMTFGELLQHAHFKVKLGAVDGSGFFFCGNLAGVDTDHIDDTILTGLEKALESSERNLQALKNTNQSYKHFEEEQTKAKKTAIAKAIEEQHGKPLTPEQKEQINTKFEISRVTHRKWKTDITKRIDRVKSSQKTLRRDIDNFTSIKDREIVKFYPSVDEIDTYICIIKGRERGFAWTTEEFERGYSSN